ncbi:MAG TPA: hypothetical protein VHA07_10000 [Devosia sp.]|nr:hypothetical protein [Devosia sp.]
MEGAEVMIPLRIQARLAERGIIVQPLRTGAYCSLVGIPGLHWVAPTGGEMEWRDWLTWAGRIELKAAEVRSLATELKRRKADDMKAGDRVYHRLYGCGVVRTVDVNAQCKVLFDRDRTTRAQRRVWLADLQPGAPFYAGRPTPAGEYPRGVA